MLNNNPSFSHHFFQIAQAQGISQTAANTLGNNIDGIMQSFEGVSDQRHRQATSKNRMLSDSTLMRQNPWQSGWALSLTSSNRQHQWPGSQPLRASRYGGNPPDQLYPVPVTSWQGQQINPFLLTEEALLEQRNLPFWAS